MRQLEQIQLVPTRYADPETATKDYKSWFLHNRSRKTDFVDQVEFLRTATIGRFYLLWLLACYIEDMRLIQSGKTLKRRVIPD